MTKKGKPGVPHRVRFGVAFDKGLHTQVKEAALNDKRSLSNWLEVAAHEFIGCATPKFSSSKCKR
jgi:hypothetical protein